jgi:large subunit ribosomal protein L32
MQGVSNTAGLVLAGMFPVPAVESPVGCVKISDLSFRSIMAVQQNKKSPSKRGMHRAHDFLVAPPIAVEPTTGETHRRHHISPNGFYRGRKVLKTKNDE